MGWFGYFNWVVAEQGIEFSFNNDTCQQLSDLGPISPIIKWKSVKTDLRPL